MNQAMKTIRTTILRVRTMVQLQTIKNDLQELIALVEHRQVMLKRGVYETNNPDW
jgi:hypothetical protein